MENQKSTKTKVANNAIVLMLVTIFLGFSFAFYNSILKSKESDYKANILMNRNILRFKNIIINHNINN